MTHYSECSLVWGIEIQCLKHLYLVEKIQVLISSFPPPPFKPSIQNYREQEGTKLVALELVVPVTFIEVLVLSV